jgi:hypothetical protein
MKRQTTIFYSAFEMDLKKINKSALPYLLVSQLLSFFHAHCTKTNLNDFIFIIAHIKAVVPLQG